MEDNTFVYKKPFLTFVKLYKGNYQKLFVSFIFFIIKHSPVWVMPIIVSNLINIASRQNEFEMKAIMGNVFIMVVLLVTNIPTALIYTRYMSLSIRSVESNIRMNMVKKLQILSIPYHKHLKGGKLQSKVLRDVELIINLSSIFCTTIVQIVLNIFVAFTITITKNIYVAIFFLATIPVGAFLIKKFRFNIENVNTKLRKSIEDMSSAVSQMVEMVPVTRAHALENIEIHRVDEKVLNVKKSGYKVDMFNCLFGACGWVTFQIMQVVCLLFSSFFAMKGYIEIGDIVLYQTYFSTILGSLTNIIDVYPQIVKGFDSINSISEIFLADDVELNSGKIEVKDVKGEFEFKDVSFRYDDGEDEVLEDFNIHVKKGERIAFVGESGGGKSTLLQLIVGFLKPTQGMISLDGQDMSKINLRSYRKFIAMVPQNTVLFSGTIKENITYGMEVTDDKLNDIIEAACLKEVINKLPNGIDTVVGEHGDLLSGGQKQRISIARALIRDPQVIILDEATSALDNKSEIHVQNAMKNLMKDRTTFMVAHRLSTIQDAERIIVIDGGRVVEEGSYDELMKRKGAFYNLSCSKTA